MARTIVKVVGGLVITVGVIGVVFVVGMRSKSPVVLNAVRRTGRKMKPLVLKTAGTPGASASVVRHVGRTSGNAYETPVVAVATDGGFVIALPYGPNTDWLKNVLASGSATIVHEGHRAHGRPACDHRPGRRHVPVLAQRSAGPPPVRRRPRPSRPGRSARLAVPRQR